MLNLSNKIKKLLGMEYEIDSKPFRKVIFCAETAGMLNITNVTAKQKGKNITVYVESHRVGVFIGKGGIQIDFLARWMTDKSDGYIVKIDIQESKLFQGLFD